jgi:hypothetical protein
VTELKDCIAIFLLKLSLKGGRKKRPVQPIAKYNLQTQSSQPIHLRCQFPKYNQGSLILEELSGCIFSILHLYEIGRSVQGNQTGEIIMQAIYSLCKILGKTPVLCKDAPGLL